MTHDHREAVGANFDPALMLRARERAWTALQGICAQMRPGISEEEAHTVAHGIFADLGMERLWHPSYIRIGRNTVKTYREPSDPGVRLGENDIYFIDLGLVFDGHEGDVGDTFTVGEAPEKAACAQAVRDLYAEIAEIWRTQGTNGRDLYNRAQDRAEAMGWRFNHAIKGHRISDFPHSVHKGGNLGDFAEKPSGGLWVLEIQIAHPTEPYGAFYEDLLSDRAA